MTGLKLTRLPDRVPVKITIAVQPELKKALDDYALLYAKSYGAEEQVADLIPYMMEAFLKADIGFRKGRKDLQDEPVVLPVPTRRGSRPARPATPTPPEET